MILWIIFIAAIPIVIIYFNSKNKANRASEKFNNDKWLEQNNYHPSVDFSYESIMHDISARFMVDEHEKVVLISFMSSSSIVIKFSDIIGCAIREDSRVSGGIGRAVVGGVLAGGAGAIVGASTAKRQIESYEIAIYTNSINSPEVSIKLINTKERTDGINYKNAVNYGNRVNSTIKVIIFQNQNATTNGNKTENSNDNIPIARNSGLPWDD